MAFSQVDICNKALIRVGSQTISSITESTVGAQTLNAIWDMTRDAELAAHPWTFAMKRADLPALSAAPTASQWARAFQLPSDLLRLVEAGEFWSLYLPSEAGPYFEIVGSTIECDEASPLRIRYTRRVTNPGEFTTLFADALACRLAAEIAEKLTQSAQKREMAWKEYAMTITSARRSNAIEQPPQRPVMDSWELAMRGMAG